MQQCFSSKLHLEGNVKNKSLTIYCNKNAGVMKLNHIQLRTMIFQSYGDSTSDFVASETRLSIDVSYKVALISSTAHLHIPISVYVVSFLR